LGIQVHESQKWWKHYRKTDEDPYKKSVYNQGRKKEITPEHDQFIRNVVVDLLAQQFDNILIWKLLHQ
ncbi:hypothetical protein BCV71DRAFT_277608, partial [Rhizopus microsporus]